MTSQTAELSDEGSDPSRDRLVSLKNWGSAPPAARRHDVARNVVVECGWGRLIFGQTFGTPEDLARTLAREAAGRRDVAFYVREPHVVLARAPQTLFLDPSHSFRLDLRRPPSATQSVGLRVRAATEDDVAEANRLYRVWNMVPVADGFVRDLDDDSPVQMLVAETAGPDGAIVGVTVGVDHRRAFNDPDNGSSLWALAVDPQSSQPGIGEALVLALAERFRRAGRAFMDLSVMHDNERAIALYRKLGFEQVPVYAVKCKNTINEKLYLGPPPDAALNIYGRIIVDEARRRGIAAEIEDAEAGLFRLVLGGRSIACRESLSDLTSAVALSRCDDKSLTRRILARANLAVPEQILLGDDGADAEAFLARHGRVVVKPARGEQGRAVAVDIRTPRELANAIASARSVCERVVLEQFVAGQDLRVIVIDYEVVAAAVRRPAAIRGNGRSTVLELIERQSRRRAAATGGESRIPLDAETERCVGLAGYGMADVPPSGRIVPVRKTANLHAGGTIRDVTPRLHPALAAASVAAARALEIPVVGLDLIVKDPAGPDHMFIEANERPGLANHEPAPTAARFIDLLFPQTRRQATGGVRA